MNQEDFVQVFQDDDFKDVNQTDQDHNATSNAIDEPNNSLGDRRYIHNDTSFATTSSFNNTKFDPMSSSDNIDQSDFNHNHSTVADFGFLPDSPRTTETFHSKNISNRPYLQHAYTDNPIESSVNLPQSNTSKSVNTFMKNVSTIPILHCGFNIGVQILAGYK